MLFLRTILLICLCFSFQISWAQVNFTKFPLNNQILQRDERDEATITVQANVETFVRGKITLRIWQEQSLFWSQDVILEGQTHVSFSPKIKAGEHNYYVKAYLNDNEIKKADRVVAGDVYLFYGQSNALGYSGINEYVPLRNVFLRYYVMYHYENKDGEWLVPSESIQWPGTGLFPLELERMLYQEHRYPIGVVVGAVGGADIATLSNRNPANPTDIHTEYGKLLTMTSTSGLRDQIKYLVFRHGESDATFQGFSEAYPQQFTKLFNYIKTDFPALKKVYNFQANLLTDYNPKAGFLREFQRNVRNNSPLITNLSTVGTQGYDGLHYNTAGYRQTATELARVISKEIYGVGTSPEIYSPNLKEAYWEQNKLVLAFDDNMKMVYPKDTVVHDYLWRMKDYIYINGKAGSVDSGYAVGNKIYLITNTRGTKVSYLPPFYNSFSHFAFYNGTHITNSLGMRAFSFDNVTTKNNTIEVDSKIGPVALRIDTNKICVGAEVSVFFTNTQTATSNDFQVQLSDAKGNFASGPIIGEGDASPINIRLPDDIPAGAGYKIRLIQENKTNALTTNAFEIQIRPTAVISTTTPRISVEEDAAIHLEFEGLPPIDFILSDSSKHRASGNKIDLLVKPEDSFAYTVLEVKNACGIGKTDGTANIEVLKGLLAHEPEVDTAILVYPNPATEYVYIRNATKLPFEIKLFDTKGKLVEQKYFQESGNFSTHHLSKGIYFYRIKSGKLTKSGKILIQ